MKKILTPFFLLLFLSSNAQYTESLSTTDNANDVFFNLNDRTKTVVPKTTWDIGFTTAGFDVSIIVNENQGAAIYEYSSDTSAWMSVDTNGFDYASNRWYNSNESWSMGAFANNGESHPNYGWGTYTSSNHHVYGSKIFIIQVESAYYQIMIEELTVGGEFKFKIADIGGANTKKLSVKKSDFEGKNFFYYKLATQSVVDAEPMADAWQLLFSKYHAADIGNYLVSGVKINSNLMVAERSGVDVSSNDTNGLAWNENITEIGYDWKVFNGGTFSYDITADLSYFVKNEGGDVWKIWFTAYSGGTYDFNVEKIASNASVREYAPLEVAFYPNPSQGVLNVENNEGEQLTLSIYSWNGQELYSMELLAKEEKQLDVNFLSKGLYILKWNSPKGIASQKLIID